MDDDERLPDDVLTKIREALEQSARGEVVDLGDFTQYLDNQDVMSPTEELHLLLIAHEPFDSVDFIEVERPEREDC